jgi:DNA repair exonuclease SbcCD ATPase subunit
VEDLKERVAELKEKNRELTDKEMVFKAAIKQLDAYVSEQVRLVTDTINGLFDDGVSFALFSENYAGAESELKETCVCMYNGKVYSSLSTGERFVANLKVTQALQRAYGVRLPLFCDNAECCTRGFSGEQQIITLLAVSDRELDNCIQVQKSNEK